MEQLLSELVERLVKAHKDSLIAVVLYGSGVSPELRDRLSDVNVLCVLKHISADELKVSEPIFRWWREMKNPSPLLLSDDEISTATDCFPMEFHDIKERHRILYGADLVAGIEVNDVFYRAQVEHELRAKMLRLRQKAGGVLSDNELLLRLMAESVSTFCVLFRHALRLAGEEPKHGKREVVAAAREKFGIDAGPFEALLAVREGNAKPRNLQPESLFREYLKQIRVMVDAVDRIER